MVSSKGNIVLYLWFQVVHTGFVRKTFLCDEEKKIGFTQKGTNKPQKNLDSGGELKLEEI